MEYSVTLRDVIDEFDLKPLNGDKSIDEKLVTKAEVNRLALQLTGFFEHFDCTRIQIIGLVEHTYLNKLDETARNVLFAEFFKCNPPCVVLTRGLRPHNEMLFHATANNIPLLSTDVSTSDFIGEIIKWLKTRLALRITMPGVLVDVYGEGLLITGNSGIGKSETALELIKRGHRFVADDAVEIKKVSNQTLVGTCPELTKYFIEVRGIGIIDVWQTFGVQSIKVTQSVDLVIKLESWNDSKEYDRFGLAEEYTVILGNRVICHTVPVTPGRNLAVICETAAINHRQKKMGYNAARHLSERISENARKNS